MNSSSSLALAPRSGRKRAHPLGDSALALMEQEEPPSRKARRDVLTTQVETLQAELEHERSLRTLDQKRFAQSQQRLERKLDFVQEEAQEAKTLMEELREESETYAEQLRAKYTRLQMDYRDLQSTLDQDRANRADEDAEEDPQIQALQDRLDAKEEETDSLQGLVRDLRNQVQGLQDQLVLLQTNNKNNNDRQKQLAENPVLAASPAPPKIQKELTQARIQISELERTNRQLQRVNDDLKVQAKALVHSQEQRKSAASRVQQLEDTLKNRDKTLSLVQAELTSWKDFGTRLGQVLAPKNSSTSLSSNPNIPPEVSVVQRFLQDATQQAQQAQTENQGLLQNLERADERVQQLEATIRELEQSKKAASKEHEATLQKVQVAEGQIKVLEGQEGVWKREIESLRAIVTTFDELPLPGSSKTSTSSSASEAKVRMLQASLDAAQEELKVLKGGQQSIQDELDQSLAKKEELQKTHNTVLEKFGKLREAVYAERNKSEKAEARAVHAETLAGKGAFNAETTRVLHLKQNPLTEALKQEVAVLKRQVEALSAGSESTKQRSAGGIDVDPNKLHKRLKESFKEQIGRFREGVYLLTGFKIDMIPDGERPRFKVRSLFAERESDHLLFQWPEGSQVDSLDLLDTELAKLLTRTPSYEYIARFHSLPAFLASTQLSLFEKQTIM